MASGIPSDYYAALEIPSTASQQQIRDAYKRAALRTHPDRVASDSPERSERTRKFQQVNDAYYTLSDPARRRDYDQARRFHGFGSDTSSSSTAYEPADPGEEIPTTSAGGGSSSMPGGFPWSSFGFGSKANTEEERRGAENEQFADVFEEMLREEGMADGEAKPTGKFWSVIGGLSGGAMADGEAKPTGKFWSVIGGLSGGAMGFIVANFPGMLAGAVAGNRLGSIRDARGKSVFDVFQELPQGDKARLLSQLAAKVFSHAVGSGY